MKIVNIVWSDLRFYPPIYSFSQTAASKGYSVKTVGFSQKDRVELQLNNLTYVWFRVPFINSRLLPLRTLAVVSFAFRVLLYLVREKPFCVVGHSLQGFAISSVLCQFLKKCSLVYYCHEYVEYKSATIFLKMAKLIERRNIRRAYGIVVPEENRARLLKQDYMISNKMFIIPNVPIQATFHCNDETLDHIIERITAMRKNGYVIGIYAGRLSMSTCIPEILKAISTISCKLYTFLIGFTDEDFVVSYRDIPKATKKYSIEDAIPYKSIQRILALADLGIVFYKGTSLNERYAAPCKLYEYMKAGLCVVAQSTSAIGELVKKEDIGVCVNPSDPAEIKNQLEYLLKHPNIIERKKANSRRLFQNRMNYEDQSRDLFQYINSIAV